MKNSNSNRNLTNAVLNGVRFNVSNYIDNTYGYWSESYSPFRNGYRRVIGGASNWTYCPVCGTPAGQTWCDCDHTDESQYQFFSNSDMVAHLRKLRNRGYDIEF
jgi:hypothetical protein